jgi:two-component system, LuxR family, sensor kinase FixL
MTSMINDALGLARRKLRIYPALALLCATAIFLTDTFTPFNTAIAVLYIAVIMLSASYLSREALLAIVALCIFLTIASFGIAHAGDLEEGALARCLISLSAIAITTVLALRNNQATRDLRDQAALLDLTHDAIYVRDDRDIITYWNAAAEDLYGWKREEAIGRSAAVLLKSQFSMPFERIAAILERTGKWQGEITHARHDGSEVVVTSRWSQERDDAGRPIATMVTNTDITDQKRTEKALLKSQGELAHAARLTTLGELLASIAHEVNQPLAAVVTNGEAALRWLHRDIPVLPEIRTSLERMISEGRRASDVIFRLRALTRRGDILRTPLNVNELVGDAIRLLDRELQANNVTLILSLTSDLPPIMGDRVQLQQAIMNLTVNAIQALAVKAAPRIIRIATFTDGETAVGPTVVLEVDDNGPGIAREALGTLFTAFYTTKAEGMGMGLSICRSIIESHGGKIFARSEFGNGATFLVSLPTRGECDEAD